MTRAVCLLQNAWCGYHAGREWPRDAWLEALHASPTGRSLARIYTPPAPGIFFANTTPEVSRGPSGVCAPDLAYVRAILDEQAPDYVLACGKQAEKTAIAVWPSRLLCMPHPAWRLMTNRLLDMVRKTIETNRFERIRISSRSPSEILVDMLTPQ